MRHGISPISLQRAIKGVRRRVSSLAIRARKLFGKDIEYGFRDYTILLPPYHQLPAFQQAHPLYDRFLPHLAKHIQAGQTVIDVGANCGDTLAAMYEANRSLNYVCIEPDDTFYEYLQNNAARIGRSHGGASIRLQKSLVGRHVTGATLTGSGGTKHAVVTQSGEGLGRPMRSVTLDHIVYSLGLENVRLIKSDVDGFDYDVLDSAESTILSHNPIIYFECQFDAPGQKSGYQETIERLQNAGYTHWVIFDNFGDVVVQTCDLKLISAMMDYVERQNDHRATRTICYYDILAVTDADKDMLARVVAGYLAS